MPGYRGNTDCQTRRLWDRRLGNDAGFAWLAMFHARYNLAYMLAKQTYPHHIVKELPLGPCKHRTMGHHPPPRARGGAPLPPPLYQGLT